MWLKGQLKVCDPMGQVGREGRVGKRKPHEGTGFVCLVRCPMPHAVTRA